jgi:hypothetical protein
MSLDSMSAPSEQRHTNPRIAPTVTNNAGSEIDWLPDDEEIIQLLQWWRTTPAPSGDAESTRIAWRQIESALGRPGDFEVADWIGLIRQASESLIAAITTDLPQITDPGAAANHFLSTLNRELGARRVPIRCGLIFAGSRFDADTMESIDTRSSNRFVVHQVCSWLVRDLSGPQPRIAARARVITA